MSERKAREVKEMLLLTSFLVVIYQEGNQYNMETFSLITCQSLWTKEFDLSSLMRGPKQDIKTFDNSIAVFRVNRVTLHVVSEVSMESVSIEVDPSQLEGERHIFQYPQFWSFTHSYLALPFQMTPPFVEVMSIKLSFFLHKNLIL